jgi:hypothetical protein
MFLVLLFKLSASQCWQYHHLQLLELPAFVLAGSSVLQAIITFALIAELKY